MLLKNISSGARGLAIKGSIVFADVNETIDASDAEKADVIDALDAGYFEEVKAEAKPRGRPKAAEAEAAE